MEPDVVEHIGYSFDNKSNFDVRKKELDHVLDIPVFPAQNLILDTQNVNIYDRPSSVEKKLPVFIYNDKIYYLLMPHKDQRFVFLEYDEYSRLLDYRFGGRVYAQGRVNASYALSPDAFYVWGGNVSDRDDMRDLWRYDLETKTWVPEFAVGEDLSIADYPSDRRNSNLTIAGSEKFIFGGEVYIEIGNDVIPLNDLWWYDGVGWNVLDQWSLLPHESGLVVWFDNSIIKLLIGDNIWTVYKDGLTATTYVPYNGNIDGPLPCDALTYYDKGAVCWCDFRKNIIYSWDDVNETIVKLKLGTFGIGYDNITNEVDYYVTESVRLTRRGENSQYQPEIRIYVSYINNWDDDTIYKTCDIEAVPLGEYMATTDIEGGLKYTGLGIRETQFIEDHYIWDGNTNNVRRVGSDGVKPQERMLAGSCYDAKRNRIWLFGGYTGSIYYNDLWYLSLDDLTWTRVRRRLTELTNTAGEQTWPSARARSGLTVVDDTLWIVAGYSDMRSYADMWMYHIEDDYAELENLTDWVAFGSDYFLFQWRDRLWLFNGEYKLYRYFFEHKQFAPVTIYATRYPEIQQRIEDREFIIPPMRLSVQNNFLILSYLDSVNDEWLSFFIDMDSKEIIQYPGDINTASFWYNQTRGMDTEGYLYFYNVSPFDFAQRNQYPYYEYSVSPITSDMPLSRDSCLMYYWDADITGGSGTQRISYVDAENMYVIYNDQVEYSPILPTFGEMTDGLLADYWPQTDYSIIDGSEGSDQIDRKTEIGQGRFRTLPRFLWKRIPSLYADKLRRASISWQDEASKRTYIVNNQDGHILRYRAKDGTFFNYPSKLWPEGVTGRRGNLVFAFMGNNQQIDSPPGLAQSGATIKLNDEQFSLLGGGKDPKQLCHAGIMMYDLNYLSFQLRLLADHPDLETRNYDQIRDYLVGVARGQLNIHVTGEELSGEWIDKIENAVYSDTVSVVGDLSVRNIVNESGIRPFGVRVAGLSTQIGRNIYYGGGALKWSRLVSCPCDPMNKCTDLKYSNFYPQWDEEKGEYIKRYYNDFYIFNTDTRHWTQLADLPYPLYGGTMVASSDNTKLYLVGGYTGDDLSGASARIWTYDIDNNSWDEMLMLPRNYGGRALPAVEWIDDYRLIIMFGVQATKHHLLDKYVRVPIADTWLIDTVNQTMYKMFECQSKTSMILDSMTDNEGYMHMIDYNRIWYNNIYDKTNMEAAIKQALAGENNQDLANADPTETCDDNTFPVEDTPQTQPIMQWHTIDPVDGQINWVSRIEVPKTLAPNLTPDNIIKDFVDPRGDLWLIVNQLVVRKAAATINEDEEEEPGEVLTSYNMYFYRVAKDNPWNFILTLLPIDVPLDAGVRLVGYDGLRYVYCIWNEFNIWQLDLETAIFNPNGEYWRRMPPYPDLAEMGIWETDKEGVTTMSEFTKSEPYGDEILFYHANGLVLRFDPTNYVWRIDRYPDNTTGKDLVVVKDGEELYYYAPGYTHGTLIGLRHKQEDKFYFDAELLEVPEDMKMPAMDAIIEDIDGCLGSMSDSGESPSYDDCISVGCSPTLATRVSTTGEMPLELWKKLKGIIADRRSTVMRNRILSFNKNNHMLRAWVKKHGVLDLYMEFDSYYPSGQIDISVDYDTMAQAGQYKFTCWTSTGIQEGIGTMVQEDTGYDWDPFSRIYKKMVELPGSPGDYTYIETERPAYYIRFPLDSNSAIRKLHLEFEPIAHEWNYISRLNHVYVKHDSDSLIFKDDMGPIDVVYIEPFSNIESDIYLVRAMNNHPTDPAKNVKVQLVKNYRVLLSKDNVEWKRATIDDPLLVAQSLDPGQSVSFYLKALSYFDKSNLDMVIRAEFPPI